MIEPDELYHYGVLGMKWGHRKNPSRAFAKSAKKANKLNKKISKAENKVAKYTAKRDKLGRRYVGFGFSSKQKLAYANQDVYRWQRKLNKRTAKAEKWEKAMSETFKNTKASDIRQKDLDTGKEYVSMLRKR